MKAGPGACSRRGRRCPRGPHWRRRGWSGTSSTRGCRTPTASATGGRWASSPPWRSGPPALPWPVRRPDLPLGWLFLAVGVVQRDLARGHRVRALGARRRPVIRRQRALVAATGSGSSAWCRSPHWCRSWCPTAGCSHRGGDRRSCSASPRPWPRADLRGRSVLRDHARPGHGRAAQPGLGPVDGRARGQRPAHPRHRRGGHHGGRRARRAVAPLARRRAAAAEVGAARDRASPWPCSPLGFAARAALLRRSRWSRSRWPSLSPCCATAWATWTW